MDMTYEEMLREMEAYFAASAPTPTVRVRSVTRHEEMLERLCGKNAQDEMLLAALRKMFSAEEVETWLLCPAFSEKAEPMSRTELEDSLRPELRAKVSMMLDKLLDRKVLLEVKSATRQGYFARCDAHCVRTLRNMADTKRSDTASGMVKFTAENCVGCKLCAKFCPVNAVQVLGKQVIIDDTLCMGCGACVRKCPKKALRL